MKGAAYGQHRQGHFNFFDTGSEQLVQNRPTGKHRGFSTTCDDNPMPSSGTRVTAWPASRRKN